MTGSQQSIPLFIGHRANACITGHWLWFYKVDLEVSPMLRIDAKRVDVTGAYMHIQCLCECCSITFQVSGILLVQGKMHDFCKTPYKA